MKLKNVEFIRAYSGNGGARYNVGEQASFSEKVVKDLVSQGVAKIVPLPGDPPEDKPSKGEEVSVVKEQQTKDVQAPEVNKMIDKSRDQQYQKQRPKLNR